ncbi:MAG: T9SS type A sorting domain-containing protein [bacterium]|nr:MAG: T9SS type A sorting domain-containing protein [bacterium]
MSYLKISIVSIFIIFIFSNFVTSQEIEAEAENKSAGIFLNSHPKFAKVAFDSSHSFDVLHYRLDLTFPLDSPNFSGMATISCRSNLDNLDEIYFDMAELTVDSVFLWDQPVSATQSEDKIFIPLGTTVARDDTFNVSIFYHSQTPNTCFFYYEKSSYTDWPIGWFPSFNMPWDKATAELYITVPVGVEVASIGLLEGRSLSPNNQWETFHWRTKYPVAPYLFFVAMSEFYTNWSDWYISADGDSIELSYFVFQEDYQASVYDFAHMAEAMDFFSEGFGPYPFEKYGMAELEPYFIGGMEYQTMSAINSNWIRGDRLAEHGLVHELAHQWWGDAVTFNDWSSIWLHEGFAEYSASLFLQYKYGQSAFLERMTRARDIYFETTETYDHPIFNPPIEQIFHLGICYKKSAWILHMLRYVVGEESFWNILQTYYQEYKYGNATIPEFHSICESISSMDLDWFFQEWIYDIRYPKLEYSWVSLFDTDHFEVKLTIDQVQETGPLFQMPIDVRLSGNASSLDTTVWIYTVSQSYTFETEFETLDLLLDPDEWVLKDTLLVPWETNETIENFDLRQNFPNPFNLKTNIEFSIPNPEFVVLKIYNTLGQEVTTLVSYQLISGNYNFPWDASGFASGVYLYRLQAGDYVETRKMVLMK